MEVAIFPFCHDVLGHPGGAAKARGRSPEHIRGRAPSQSVQSLVHPEVTEERRCYQSYLKRCIQIIYYTVCQLRIPLGFQDPSALLKHELAYCLGQIKNTAALPTLEEVLADLKEDPMVRHEVSFSFPQDLTDPSIWPWSGCGGYGGNIL